MLYTEEEKRQLERVISVFDDYLKNSPHVDLVWSNKLGYVFFDLVAGKRRFDMDPIIIMDGEMLCRSLFFSMAMDVLELSGPCHDPLEADPQERAAIEKHLTRYTEQLPEYQSLVSKLFEPNFND